MAAGYPLTVWNRSRPGIDELVGRGAAEAAGPRGRGRALRRGDHDRRRLAGRGGRRPGAERRHRGAAGRAWLHIDMSTISPAVTRRIAAALAGGRRGDARRAGERRRAGRDQRHALDHGRRQPEATFERCRPVFEAMGRTIVHCGPSGSGQTVKLCNQIAVALNNLAMCEALRASPQEGGVDPRTMLEAVSAGAATSWAAAEPGAEGAGAATSVPASRSRTSRRTCAWRWRRRDEQHLPAAGHGAGAPALRGDGGRGPGREGIQALVKALEKLAGVQVVVGGSKDEPGLRRRAAGQSADGISSSQPSALRGVECGAASRAPRCLLPTASTPVSRRSPLRFSRHA